MKYDIYDVDYAVRDEKNSPKKFGYYTQKNTPVKMQMLIDEMSDDVYVDRYSSDARRVCLRNILQQIQLGDEVYIGTEHSFSTNKQLHYAYNEIILLKGGKVFDLSNSYEYSKLINNCKW